MTEIKRMAQLIASRQFERPVREQLYLYLSERGLSAHLLDDAMMVHPSDYDAWGYPMYIDSDIEEMLEILNQ